MGIYFGVPRMKSTEIIFIGLYFVKFSSFDLRKGRRLS